MHEDSIFWLQILMKNYVKDVNVVYSGQCTVEPRYNDMAVK